MAGIGNRIIFIWVMYSWRLGIFAVGLQMAIKLNHVKSSETRTHFLLADKHLPTTFTRLTEPPPIDYLPKKQLSPRH